MNSLIIKLAQKPGEFRFHSLKVDLRKANKSEVLKCFHELGFYVTHESSILDYDDFLFVQDNGRVFSCENAINSDCYKWITLEQLKDMVILHRNDVSDANYSITVASDRPDYPVFKSSTGIFHTYSENNSKWVECKSINDKTSGLKAVAVETIKVKGFEDLIDGKAALAAALAGEKVQISLEPWEEKHWDEFLPEIDGTSTKVFFTGFHDDRKVFFRIKPKTITINGIEVPAPFSHRPEVGQVILYLDDSEPQGFTGKKYSGLHDADFNYGWWASEEKIKMVVDALRKVFEVQS